MHKKITCLQMNNLINFYTDKSLNPKLKHLIDEHLATCKQCQKLYAEYGITINAECKNQYDNEFIANLSAYIDNELSEHDSVRFKRATISNPTTRKQLENMYTLKKYIQMSTDKIKGDFRTDYSKQVIKTLKGENSFIPFNKLAWTFAGMMCAILFGFLFIATLYF